MSVIGSRLIISKEAWLLVITIIAISCASCISTVMQANTSNGIYLPLSGRHIVIIYNTVDATFIYYTGIKSLKYRLRLRRYATARSTYTTNKNRYRVLRIVIVRIRLVAIQATKSHRFSIRLIVAVISKKNCHIVTQT
jgi:hypothetical protein